RLVMIDPQHLGQAVPFARARPPAEDVQLARARRARPCAGSAGSEKIREAETEHDSTSRFSRSADKLSPRPTLVPHLDPPLDTSLSSCQAAARVYVEAPLDDKNRTSALTLSNEGPGRRNARVLISRVRSLVAAQAP